MKRIRAVSLAVIFGAALLGPGLLTVDDAEAWRGRHSRHRYRGGRRHFRARFFFPAYAYWPRHSHHHYGGHYHSYGDSYWDRHAHYPSGGTVTTYERRDNSSQILGAILGGIGGGVIGSTIGAGGGKALATVAGSFIGLLAGGEIGKQLDEGQRLAMARTTDTVLETSRSGTEVPWRDPDSGVQGTVTPKPAYKNARGQFCREYTQTVTIDGKTRQAYGTACRQPDGSWTLAD
jgi:surface antigen